MFEDEDREEFEIALDTAIDQAVKNVCSEYNRLAGSFLGIVRWFDEGEGGVSITLPENQLTFDTFALSKYLEMIINTTTINWKDDDNDL